MEKVIKPSENFFKLIEYYECAGNINKYLTAYIDNVGVPTIGYGTTRYPNGQKVNLGDKIDLETAKYFLLHDTKGASLRVDGLCRDDITQNEFDALLSFVYNCGDGALAKSTLLKLVNSKNTDPNLITKWFTVWNKGYYKDKKDNDNDGLIDEPGELVELPGLTKRRKTEAHLYLTGELKFNF